MCLLFLRSLLHLIIAARAQKPTLSASHHDDRQPEKIAEEENKISGKKVTSIWEHMYVHLMEATSATGNAAKLGGKETINSHLFSLPLSGL